MDMANNVKAVLGSVAVCGVLLLAGCGGTSGAEAGWNPPRPTGVPDEQWATVVDPASLPVEVLAGGYCPAVKPGSNVIDANVIDTKVKKYPGATIEEVNSFFAYVLAYVVPLCAALPQTLVAASAMPSVGATDIEAKGGAGDLVVTVPADPGLVTVPGGAGLVTVPGGPDLVTAADPGMVTAPGGSGLVTAADPGLVTAQGGPVVNMSRPALLGPDWSVLGDWNAPVGRTDSSGTVARFKDFGLPAAGFGGEAPGSNHPLGECPAEFWQGGRCLYLPFSMFLERKLEAGAGRDFRLDMASRECAQNPSRPKDQCSTETYTNSILGFRGNLPQRQQLGTVILVDII